MKLKNKFLSLAGIFIIFFAPVGYAEISNNIISFSTEVEKEVQYDLLEATLFIQSEDKELKSATKQVNSKINAALDIIRNVKSVEIKENSRTTHVRYNSKNKQDGWIAYGKLVLESQDDEQLAKVLTQLDGILAIDSLRPSVSSSALLNIEDTMIKDVLKQFQHKANLIRSSLNAKNYKIQELSITTPVNQNKYAPRMFQASNTKSYDSSVDIDLGESKTLLKANARARIEIIFE
ncbi:putative secreted protein [Bisgaardia hudsonensis]|uniref:Putative secreted protein n=1 Tax=Bisgaardia hudsonensis TaxID=109472 RepID=A0A4R2MVF3_9PAST|nr:SIMPL domain-containing protein [Bisgaardia hudsonensis]QLB12228.1 hypothetical protein A6A11_00650 [Bisgaardia hudsonensis]TCP12271.1 putative secreted protein [Bisgaardia hudsonensis]